MIELWSYNFLLADVNLRGYLFPWLALHSFDIMTYEWRLKGTFGTEQISLSLAIFSFSNSGTNEVGFDKLMSSSGKVM
jgi:hypothetical protein